MAESYIVMRGVNAEGAAHLLGTTLRHAGPQVEVAGFLPPAIQIDLVPLERAEAGDLARDPSVLGPVLPMPLRLIEPVPRAADGPDPAPLWGLGAIGADTTAATGAGVTVAVLDTGIDPTHPAFAGVQLDERRNFTAAGDDDGNGHGTHCAGTIFGRDVGGTRIGVARGVTRALIGKVLDDERRGTSDMLFSALTWASESGAHVISMSLGFDFAGLVEALVTRGHPVDIATSMTLDAYRGNLRMFDAVMGTIRARRGLGGGSVVVAATGNESRRDQNPDWVVSASLPAAADGIVAVGAVGPGPDGLLIAPFSNSAAMVVGPGVDIESAAPGGGTALESGTSMACPHVAGAAALWWQEVLTSGFTGPDFVIAKLQTGATLGPLAPGSAFLDRGAGLVQVPG